MVYSVYPPPFPSAANQTNMGSQSQDTAGTLTASTASVVTSNPSGDITIKLPPAVSISDNWNVQLINLSTHVVTVDGNGSQISGASTYPLDQQWQSVSLIYKGGQFIVL